MRKICEKLHVWSQGREIDNICGEINKRYPTLESCDYQGPNTYTNREDIPEELKFVIQETFSENFDSSSVATSDSINQIEVSYDTSEDSDDSDEESPRSHGVDQDSEQKDSGNWSDKVPKSLHSPNGITTDSDIKMIELEKSTAVAVSRSRTLGQCVSRGLELWSNRRLAVLSSGTLAVSQS